MLAPQPDAHMPLSNLLSFGYIVAIADSLVYRAFYITRPQKIHIGSQIPIRPVNEEGR